MDEPTTLRQAAWEQLRKDFEEWHAGRFGQPLQRFGDTYSVAAVRNRWIGYQAGSGNTYLDRKPLMTQKELEETTMGFAWATIWFTIALIIQASQGSWIG